MAEFHLDQLKSLILPTQVSENHRLNEWMNEWMIWMNEWFEWMIDWLWMNEWMNELWIPLFLHFISTFRLISFIDLSFSLPICLYCFFFVSFCVCLIHSIAAVAEAVEFCLSSKQSCYINELYTPYYPFEGWDCGVSILEGVERIEDLLCLAELAMSQRHSHAF